MAWEAFTPLSTTTAKSWYAVYRRFGDVAVSSVTGTNVIVTDGILLTTFPPYPATWSYTVYQIETSTLTLTPPPLNSGSITSTSAVTNVDAVFHVNNNLTSPAVVLRADAAGGQSGQGQSWTFTYKLNGDADVSFAVFYPSYTTTADANGLRDADVSSVTAGGGAAVVKRILNKVPRSFRMADNSWPNTDVWDVRDSNGTLVPNGIYNYLFSAYRNGSLLGSVAGTIPVDVLRITNPAATAITDTIPNSTISYNLTGNATVRILIATSTAGGALPQFAVNSASDVVLNVGAIVQIITEAKASGSQSSIWNGLDLSGVAVSSGQYAFAISAKDTSGNAAVGPGSNDYFITGSIAVNRTPPVSNLTALTQVQNLNVVWAPLDKSATLSWDTAGAGIAYSVFRKFGIWRDTATFFASVSTVATGVTALTYKDTVGPGTWTYGVRATSGTTSGGPISAITAETSKNRFIRSISAVDGLGGQLGQGGKWVFSYKIEDNAEVDLVVLSTSTLLGTDPNGFATYLASDVVKVAISSGPRAGEGSGSTWTNSDTWDQTNAAGVQVSSGIYTVLLRSRLPATSPYYPPALRDVVVMQVPVTPAPPVVGQVQGVSVAWAPADKSATISWTALAGATGYTIYRKFGIWTSTSSFIVGVTSVTTGVVGTSYKDVVGPGAWTYGVLGEGVVGTVSSVGLDTSKNRFIRSVSAVDGQGGQLGQGGKWIFSYKIEDNANVDIIVLSTSAIPGTNATNGFATAVSTNDIVKVVITSAPRASEGTGSTWINSDTWDQTNTAGVQVSSGIYTVMIQAHVSGANPYYPPADRDVVVFQVPVVPSAAQQQTVGQVQGLTVAWAPLDKSSTLSWTALTGATGYTIYRKYGIWNSTDTFFTGASTVTTGVTLTTYKDTVGPGAWTYGVKGEGVGGAISAVSLDTSKNRFIRSVTQVDGAGGQSGLGGKWNFSYKIEDNAEVDLIVLSTSTLLGTDANGFATYLASDVVKVVLSSAPRAGEGSGSTWTNSDVWDQTNAAGVQVSSGIYTVLIRARLSAANPYYPPAARDTFVFQVPVNTTPPSVPSGSIVATEIGGSLTIAYTHGTAGNGYSPTLTWKAPNVTGQITYRVYRASGSWTFPISSGIFVGATNSTSLTDFVYYSDAQDWTYIVEAQLPSGSLSYSQYVTLPFLHDFTRADANGQQVGFGQKWKWTYKMLWDGYVTMAVYPATATYTYNLRGQAIGANALPVKIVTNFTPRSFEMVDKSFANAETWDERDAQGAIVPNGVYNVRFTAYDVTGRVLGSFVGPVPVDSLRVMDVTAVGISQSGGGGATASISYTITGAATVRILVCAASTTFTLDGNGDPQPVQGPGVIVSTISFARNPGVYTESWNGQNASGQAVASGLYVFAISAKDGFGNFAVFGSTNDYYLAGTIPVDRAQQQPQADITPPTVSVTNPANGAIKNRVSQISATLTDPVPPTGSPPPSGVDYARSSLQLTGPGGNQIVASTITRVGADLVFTLAYSTDGVVNGAYIMRVTPMDQALNTGTTVTVTFTVDATSPTISSLSPSTGTTLAATFTTVSAKLSDLGGAGLDLAGSQVALTNPSGVAVVGTVSNNGTDTLTLTVPEQKFNGAYTVTVVARDQAGNSTTLTGTFSLNVPLSATTEEFGKTLTVDQNPARAPVTFSFDVPAAGDATFEVFNLLGERVYTKTLTSSGGGRQPLPWNLVNDDGTKIGTGVYTYRVRFTGGGTNLEAKKKLVVVQ